MQSLEKCLYNCQKSKSLYFVNETLFFFWEGGMGGDWGGGGIQAYVGDIYLWHFYSLIIYSFIILYAIRDLRK